MFTLIEININPHLIIFLSSACYQVRRINGILYYGGTLVFAIVILVTIWVTPAVIDNMIMGETFILSWFD